MVQINIMYNSFFKRVVDLVVAIGAILVLSPILLTAIILIKLDSKGPVFFIQKRVGKDLKTFNVLKFRTMTDEKREVKKIVGKESSVTTVGFYLRRFKIDELPQIFHVLKGQMSIVGPRPSIPKQLEQMNEEEKKRYSVRPGLTGLSQVSGNIYLTWKERYQLDLHYINNISFWNDMKIILRTVLIVIKGEEKFLNKPLKI